MKRAFQAMTLVMLVLVACGRPVRGQDATAGASLQEALERSLPASGAIGVSAAAIWPDGALWAGAAGLSHEGVPLTTDMLLDIASVQKNLQAALALMLVERGLIALDDRVGKWLPLPPRVDGRVTLRQLLNMTSGIRDFVGQPQSPFKRGYLNIDFGKTWTWEEIQSVFIGEPSFAPGTQCEYSSTNYILLKHVIEKAARAKLPELAERKLLKPNRMDHTLVDFSEPVPSTMRIAHGWLDANDDGKAEDISGRSLNWIASLSPMLVYSTPTDLARWADALFHRKTVIKETTLKEMLDFGGPVNGEPLMKGYGLGAVNINIGALMPRWERLRVYGHLGSQFGYMAFMGYFPDYGISLVIMSNRGGDGDAQRAIVTVSAALIDALLGRLGANGGQTPPRYPRQDKI